MNLISSQTFPKYLRIRNTSDFSRVFVSGKRSNLEQIRLISLENNVEFARLGIVVNKKNLPKAVLRNKFKRVIREVFRNNKDKMGSKDYLVICKSKINKAGSTYKGEDFKRFINGNH